MKWTTINTDHGTYSIKAVSGFATVFAHGKVWARIGTVEKIHVPTPRTAKVGNGHDEWSPVAVDAEGAATQLFNQRTRKAAVELIIQHYERQRAAKARPAAAVESLGTLPRIGRGERLRAVITDQAAYVVEFRDWMSREVWRDANEERMLIGRVIYRDGMWSPEYDDEHRLGLRFSLAEAVHALINDHSLPEAERPHDYEPEGKGFDTSGPCAVCGQQRSFGLH